MSLWTDLRNAVESPFIAVGQLLTAPIDLTKDLVSGKNMLQSMREQWQEGIAPILTTPIGYLALSDTGKSVLDSKLANSLTMGMSSNVERTLQFTQNINMLTPEKITKDQALGAARTAAVIATAGAAATYAPAMVASAQAAPLSSYGAAQLTYKYAATGNIAGAAEALGGLAGVPLPSEVRDIQNAVAPIVDNLPSSQASPSVAPNRVSDPFASPAGMLAAPSSGTNPYIIPAIAALGVIALIGLSKK